MQALKKESKREVLSQFQLTTDLLRNLYKYDLTPVTKLVLLELTTHLNEDKNGFVVFPSVNYIAEVLGIGLTATKKAINDLIKEGLIIKSKRDKIKGNYNKYVLTLKVRNVRNSTSERSENDFFKQSDSDLFLLRTNKHEQIEKQTFKSGENVYKGDDLILYEYAKTRAKYSVDAFIQKIKENGGADKIISDYKKKPYNPQVAFRKTELLGQIIAQQKQDRIMPEECTAWVEFGKKIKSLQNREQVQG